MERRNSRHRYVLQISGGRRSDLNFLLSQLVFELEKLPMARMCAGVWMWIPRSFNQLMHAEMQN